MNDSFWFNVTEEVEIKSAGRGKGVLVDTFKSLSNVNYKTSVYISNYDFWI